MKLLTKSLALIPALLFTASCTDAGTESSGESSTESSADPSVETVMSGLNNPSSVAFSPDGKLTVTDANGVVYLGDGKGGKEAYLSGFPSQHWKSDDSGKKWYQVGPLSALWHDDWLAVTNAGLGDGQETVLFFDGPGKVADGEATNSVGPTTSDPADMGEGNLTGLSVTPDGKHLFLGGQGYDEKTWVLKVDVASRKLSAAFSADDHGITTNSPMDTLTTDRGTVLVLYSGAGSKVDGLVVEWDIKSGKPSNQWRIPELVNPMGFAHLGGNRYAMVENNWDLKQVNSGRVAIVTLGDEKTAEVKPTGVTLMGPVACTVGPDGRLYVTQLGSEFDSDNGSVVAIKGIQ